MLPIQRSAARVARMSSVASVVPKTLTASFVSRIAPLCAQQPAPRVSSVASVRMFSQRPALRQTDDFFTTDRDTDPLKTPEALARSVFVGNVPLNVTEQEIREHFETVDPIENIIIGPEGRFFFIYYKSIPAVTKAIDQLDGTFWRGRRININTRTPAKERPGGVRGGRLGTNHKTETVFLGNMPYSMTDDDLNKLSRMLEHCFDLRVAVDRQTGWPRGYAHADFYTVGLAERAIKRLLDADYHMLDKRIRVNMAGNQTQRERFEASRNRSLLLAGRTLEYYEDLTEKLRKEEGSWEVIPAGFPRVETPQAQETPAFESAPAEQTPAEETPVEDILTEETKRE